MYYRILSNIVVTKKSGEKIRFSSFVSLEIKKSIDSLENMASVKIPLSADLRRQNSKNQSVETANCFHKGDKISISVGYDELVEEFVGYISKVIVKKDVEIQCAGDDFLLNDNIPTETFKKATLKDVLSYILEGTNIEIDGEIPLVELTNYVIPANLSRIDAIKQLREKYGLTAYFDKNKIYMGLDFVKYKGTAKYSIGVNTPNDNELEYQHADEMKFKVKAVNINKDNTRVEETVGDKNGSELTMFFYNVKNKADLKKLAEAKIEELRYSGYKGQLTAFLQPYCEPAMVAYVINPKKAELSGKYEIRSTTLTVSTSGGRRKIEIGKPLS